MSEVWEGAVLPACLLLQKLWRCWQSSLRILLLLLMCDAYGTRPCGIVVKGIVDRFLLAGCRQQLTLDGRGTDRLLACISCQNHYILVARRRSSS